MGKEMGNTGAGTPLQFGIAQWLSKGLKGGGVGLMDDRLPCAGVRAHLKRKDTGNEQGERRKVWLLTVGIGQRGDPVCP